jgi:tetratricopeptide (TPR) repeat protein/transcriptional regulator with XRE-family HTH domain
MGDDGFLGAGVDSQEKLAGALRQLRRRHARWNCDTKLTYRELAAKSGYAHGVIGDYFSGKILPPTDRLDVLAHLLGATEDERRMLATARDWIEERRRRRREPAPRQPRTADAAARRTLPRDIAAFTGRETELHELERMAVPAQEAGICVIGGMAGVGKTALGVHAAHRLAARFPDGHFFLPLHAHTPGQQPVAPADALASLLLTTGVSAGSIPPGLEPRAAMWRDYLADKRVLLLLDDAAGHEQVRPLLPGTARSLVLVTSRRRLAALEDARTISLGPLSPGEAVKLLIRLAARDGLSPDDSAMAQITALCGYLPLAVAMLGRQLHHHPTWSAASLAADLSAAHDHRLDLLYTENVSVAAAFDLSYRDLEPAEQQMFRRLSLNPGNDMDAYAAAALDGIGLAAARRRLEALYDHHLLIETAPRRYRLHDLIREHARALAAADQKADRDAATERLLNYYLHTLCAASPHVARRQPQITVEPPLAWPELPDRPAAMAWLDAERLNLHAAADYAIASGRPAYTIAISGVMHGYLCGQGHWDQALVLHRTALDATRQSDDLAAEPRALIGLSIIQRLTGDTPAALSGLARALDLSRTLGDRPMEAAALNELGVTQHLAGNPAAVTTLSEALLVFQDLDDQSGEAAALNDLALAQLETGQIEAAGLGLARALDLHRRLADTFWEANALNNIGVAQRLQGDYQAATASHAQALQLYRDLGGVLGQANALHNTGIVQHLTGDYAGAVTSCAQALRLYRDLGDRQGEAKALNSLGEAELALAAAADATACHEQARQIAVTIGVPLEEARAQEGIGRSHLYQGRPAEASLWLHQALDLYKEIGSPHAARVAATLRDHHL